LHGKAVANLAPLRSIRPIPWAKKVSFNRINRKTGNRLKQQNVDSETGEVAPPASAGNRSLNLQPDEPNLKLPSQLSEMLWRHTVSREDMVPAPLWTWCAQQATNGPRDGSEKPERIMSDEFEGLNATEKAGIGATLNRCRALAAKIANELRNKRPEHFVDKLSLADVHASLEHAADVLSTVKGSQARDRQRHR
jgi:hypothetical protein